MDPITFAVTVFGLLASAGVAWAKHSIDSAEQKSQNDKINSLNEQNLALNEKTAQQNFDLSKEQFEYQKQLNDLTMQREDTAFQRQVSDLKAAGLSPLMVAGNGAAATPLNTANAPQFDMSGINQAMSNMIGSYNDIFNRKMQSRQFALQSKVQAAQAFTQLAELKMQQKKANLENKYLSEKLEWEKKYGFRDYDWKSIATKLLDNVLNPDNTEKPSLAPVLEKAREGSEAVTNFLDNKATYGDNNDFATYGAVPRNSPYGHTLDSENYDNDRSSYDYLSQEFLEKKNKMDLRLKDNIKNRLELYKYDDYLKKHISEENWKKASPEFVKYYLKKGQFEGHKKYFD